MHRNCCFVCYIYDCQIFRITILFLFFDKTMDAYYEKIRDPNTYGAAFFAVCRGKVIIVGYYIVHHNPCMLFKVSEGLDFADAVGRAVVITGIPFAPREDPKVLFSPP